MGIHCWATFRGNIVAEHYLRDEADFELYNPILFKVVALMALALFHRRVGAGSKIPGSGWLKLFMHWHWRQPVVVTEHSIWYPIPHIKGVELVQPCFEP